MDRQRWLTAIIILPLLLLVLLKGGRLGFVLVLLVIAGLGQWEFLDIFLPQGEAGRRIASIILGSLVVLSFCTAQRGPYLCNPSFPVFALAWVLFALFMFYLISYGHVKDLGPDLAFNALGLLYIPFLLGHFVWLRYMSQGEWWVLWLLAVMFAGDTAAYYGGRLLGKRKLYPEVSPGKTWMGAVFGLASCLAVGLLLGRYLQFKMTTPQLVGLALGLGLLGLLGDLFESMLKRQAKVKDASRLLPGHGGMLDRLDSLLFAAPAVVYVRLFLFGI